jgi:hypothetical protein
MLSINIAHGLKSELGGNLAIAKMLLCSKTSAGLAMADNAPANDMWFLGKLVKRDAA